MSIAVVVQQLVLAEAAGALFTVNPVGGAREVVINANWGLGESVVAGDVTPDIAVVDRASGTLVSYEVGTKESMTAADGSALRGHEAVCTEPSRHQDHASSAANGRNGANSRSSTSSATDRAACADFPPASSASW